MAVDPKQLQIVRRVSVAKLTQGNVVEMSKGSARPSVAVAHVVLETHRMEESAVFMKQIGMRSVLEGPEVSVFELRGGTHLLLMLREGLTPAEAPFELMVDDIRASHEQFEMLGLGPSSIEARPEIDHDVFTLLEPAGNVITVFPSHVTGADPGSIGQPS